MIAAAIEEVDARGIVAGWIQDTRDGRPMLVELRRAGHRLALAPATEFRPGLLAAGRGHGHYGFHARLLHTLPPGPAEIDLFLPRNGRGTSLRVTLPPLDLSGTRTVEDLLAAPPGWTAEQVAANPDALGLPRHRAALGDLRFVDRLYRFVLARWPAAAESEVDARALRAGRLTPEELLRELLVRRLHEGCTAALPGPFDPDFAFR